MVSIIRDGKTVSRSRNLRGIRAYASQHGVKEVHIGESASKGGMLTVNYNDGAYAVVAFASFEVLRGWVGRWRNAQGAAYFVNGSRKGAVGLVPELH